MPTRLGETGAGKFCSSGLRWLGLLKRKHDDDEELSCCCATHGSQRQGLATIGWRMVMGGDDEGRRKV
jgi:hypothetical protein